MRDLYFHIGLHKTGTTYLQHLLLENRELFRAAGLELAPYLHPREGNHHPLILALFKGDFSPQTCAEVMDRVAEGPGDRLLITAEAFSSTMHRDPARMPALHAAAARHFTPHVVVFLRRQDYLRESLFGQAAKTWYCGSIHDHVQYDIDHDARLRRLEAIFGPDRVHVAIYPDSKAHKIEDVFIAALGLDLDPGRLRPITARNTSANRREILLMSQLPKPAQARGTLRHMRFPQLLGRAIREAGVIADDGGRFFMSPRERHDLVAAHLDGNRALVARHGLTEIGDFLDLPGPDTDWFPPAPIAAEERAAARRAALRACLRHSRNPLRSLPLAARAAATFARMGAAS